MTLPIETTKATQDAAFDLLVVFTQPPLTASLPKEGLDLALVSSTFEQSTGLIFLGAGVLQLSPNQQPDCLALKGTQAMLKALALYGIDKVFVETQALVDYGLTANNLLLPVISQNTQELQALIANSRNTLTF